MVMQQQEIVRVKTRLEKVELEMIAIVESFYGESEQFQERSRRNTESQSTSEHYLEHSEDGVPVVGKKYRGFTQDGTGFRVYNAWYQHRRENEIKNDPRLVVQHATDAPIRAHHRKSAAWTRNDDYDDFLQFGDSMYSDTVSKQKKTSAATSNTVNYGRNRAKITNSKDYRNANTVAPVIVSSTTTSSPTEDGVLNEHMRNKITNRTYSRAQKTEGKIDLGLKMTRNRNLLRSGKRMTRKRNRNGVESMKKVRDAIHLEADVKGVEGPDYDGAGRLRVADGVYRNWTPSRWARRLKMDKRMRLKDGRLTIGSPGVYFIYAQINYLDTHDVNAFQVLVNDSPFLLCTTMTHTVHQTTKANTCYTGGTKFLEQGDTITIKNLEDNRFSVMLPSHSFFGVAQLSDLGI